MYDDGDAETLGAIAGAAEKEASTCLGPRHIPGPAAAAMASVDGALLAATSGA